MTCRQTCSHHLSPIICPLIFLVAFWLTMVLYLCFLIFVNTAFSFNWQNNIHEASNILGVRNKFIIIDDDDGLHQNEWFKWLLIMKNAFKNSEVININTHQKPLANQTCPEFNQKFAHPRIYFSNKLCYSKLSESILNINDKGEVWEHFLIKGLKVSNRLGTFKTNGIFIINQDIEHDFFRRRGNFLGTELKVMAEKSSLKMEFIPDWKLIAKQTNEIADTLDVTGLMTGPMQVYLDLFATKLNFTYRQFKRKDGKWAAFDPSKNQWFGMVENLQNGDADFIATAFSYDVQRSTAIDYMFPLLQQELGFAIRNTKSEQLEWLTYTKSFNKEVWILIFICVMVISISTYLITKISVWTQVNEYPNEFSYSYILLISFGSLFGITMEDSHVGSLTKAGKTSLFMMFLTGSILFYSYQAALVSHLSVPRTQLPFNTPKELLNTPYRVLTTGKTAFEGQLFVQAEKSSTFGQIYQNKMNEESFVGIREAVKKLLTEPSYQTVFGARQSIIRHAGPLQDPCEIKFVWFSPTLDYMAFAFPQKSPFLPFFNELYSQIRASGHMHQISRSFNQYGKMKCYNDSLSGISIQKFISLLIFLVVGMFISFICLVVEKIAYRIDNFMHSI